MIDTTLIDPTYLLDIVLILISGLACLYCGMLNRRLKKLQNLKTGVGASIVSLTDAITQTNRAAKDAQSTTLETVETLRHLLSQAEAATPKIDALIAELAHSVEAANSKRKLIDVQIEETLSPAIEKAYDTAECLLKVITDVDDYVEKVNSKIHRQSSSNVQSLDKVREQKADRFSAITL